MTRSPWMPTRELRQLLARLRTRLASHLAHEEADALPLISQILSPGELGGIAAAIRSLRHWDIGQHGVWGGLITARRTRLRRRARPATAEAVNRPQAARQRTVAGGGYQGAINERVATIDRGGCALARGKHSVIARSG